jgi:hypothetical protein
MAGGEGAGGMLERLRQLLGRAEAEARGDYPDIDRPQGWHPPTPEELAADAAIGRQAEEYEAFFDQLCQAIVEEEQTYDYTPPANASWIERHAWAVFHNGDADE